jgi:hypothetical protein
VCVCVCVCVRACGRAGGIDSNKMIDRFDPQQQNLNFEFECFDPVVYV